MTVRQILNTIDNLRPNNTDEETKLGWIEILEKKIAEHMTRYGEREVSVSALTPQQDVLLQSEYLYMYAYYAVAMIDLMNQDISMYNNSSTYFNDAFENWQKKWRRENMPGVFKGGDE